MRAASRQIWVSVLLAAMAVLTGCTSKSLNQAPVEDRGVSARGPVDPALLPGAANAGKPGYYTVRQGDTVMKIATDVNQPWRDIARWNNLDNPNAIEVGQVLRVVPPPGSAPPPPQQQQQQPATAPIPVATQTTPGVATTPTPTSPPEPSPAADAGDINLIWPASGAVLAKFDEVNNKGISIGGNAGDPVVAAADGSVVYAGAGLPSYGNLIILQHNTTFLTAYAHNQKLLVKENQTVKKGQKIAEMGSTGADRVMLHFEVRRSAKPVDPVRYLPAR
jgi:lipoprotein NlpD